MPEHFDSRNILQSLKYVLFWGSINKLIEPCGELNIKFHTVENNILSMTFNLNFLGGFAKTALIIFYCKIRHFVRQMF